MSRIAGVFAALREQNRAALIPYITGGDQQLDWTVPLMQALVEAGADIIEIGVPFSDPMADGPVIQQACERSLAAGADLLKVLTMVAEFRQHNSTTPVVLMGYLNPFERMGYEVFAERANAAGVDAVLTVDAPPEEAAPLSQALKAQSLDPIFLIAPTSTDSRMRAIARLASGFVYYVSLKGVTGVKTVDADAVAAKLAEIRQHTDLPVGVGFGIRDAASASAVAKVADAAVVGSVLVQAIATANDVGEAAQAVSDILVPMRQAMDASRGV